MSRTQKTKGTNHCLSQMENIKRCGDILPMLRYHRTLQNASFALIFTLARAKNKVLILSIINHLGSSFLTSSKYFNLQFVLL